MQAPLMVIERQAKKGNLTEDEVAALKHARAKMAMFGSVGFASGAGIGYFLSRKTGSIFVRGVMMMIFSTTAGVTNSVFGSFASLRDISDSKKYPHIAAAIRDITEEIYRSQGIDPMHPERRPSARIATRMPNFKDLPPSLTNDEMEAAKADGFASSEGASLSEAALDQREHQQMEFGNPSLQHQVEQPVEQPVDQPQYRVGDAGTNSGSAWDSVRATSGSQTNAWDKVRKQNVPQQQQHQRQQYQQRHQQSANQTAQQFENSWDKMYQDESSLYNRDGGFLSDDSSGSGSSSPLGSEDFPRSREDFERSSRGSNSKYDGGSAFSS